MPVALPELAAMAAFMICAFLIAVSLAYGYTFGAMLDWIAAKIRSLPSINLRVTSLSFDFLAVPFEAVNNTIRHALGAGIESTRRAGLYMWHWAAYMADELGAALESLAGTTERALRHALHIHVPRWVNNRLTHLAARVAALTALIAALPHRAKVIVQEPVKVIRTEVTKVSHVATDIALPNIRGLERDASRLRGQLKKLSKYLTPAGIIGLIGATTFSQFGLGWLRCRGVGRVGRSLCGASGLIESLYADAILAFAVTDLCRFAYGVERVAEDLRPVMLAWVDVEDALFECGSASFPPNPPRLYTSPTPVVGALAL